MSACWPLRLPPTPKAVLISLADNANDHGECWPSIPTICERTCMGERTVHGAIKWLEGAGLLFADRSNGRHTRYVVNPSGYEPPQELRPRRSCAPADAAVKPPQILQDPRSSCGQPPQELRSNRKEPSLKATVRKATVKTRSLIALPDWLPAASWEDWCDYRKGKTWTQKAQELSVASLDKLRAQGHDPTTVIENAIEKGWRGLYPPNNGQSAPQAKPSAAASFRGKTYAGTPIDQLPADLRDAARAAIADG